MVLASQPSATVWRLALDSEGTDEGRLLALLESAERRRADNFGNAIARRRFLLCRAALRLLLAERLQGAPAGLRLSIAEHGKPYLAGQPADLSFNVSHSGDMALIALGNGAPLGVDVEFTRTGRSFESIARRCFSTAELAYWRALPTTARAPAFFDFWTRKEAFAKATGKGISIGLEHIEFGPGGVLIAIPAEHGACGDWTVRGLGLGEGYHAALALAVPAAVVEIRDFDFAGRL